MVSLPKTVPVMAFLAGALLAGAVAAQERTILSRSQWNANPPSQEMPANAALRLTIHHTATRQNPARPLATKLKSLQAFSQSRSKLADGRTKPAWGDVPYHFYIGADGGIAEGREVRFVGDTNTNYDPYGHVSIVVEGNFEIEQPSPLQIAALEHLLVHLALTYGLTADNIDSHRSFAATACPGENLLALMPDIKADVARRLQALR